MIEKVTESVGKPRNYGPTAKDMEEERRQVEVRRREKDAGRHDEARREKKEEMQRLRQEEERVRTHNTMHLKSFAGGERFWGGSEGS